MTTQSSSIAATAAETSDREIVITREFDAPAALVFDAWSDPEHLSQWWGPNGFTTTTQEMDFRPGGTWRFVMHGPDGVDYDNRVVYREIDRPRRLVYAQDDGSDDPSIAFVQTITFDERNGRTVLTMRSLFPTAADLRKVVEEHGAIEGGQQTLSRLADYLARQR